jgi:hypothetical protein
MLKVKRNNPPSINHNKEELMKKLVLIAMALIFTNTLMAATNGSREVPIGISGAFVPAGFDSNSDSYVVVNGVFQNGCYKWSRAVNLTTKDEYTHEISSMATVTPGMCIMVLIPFQKEISLGKLAAGKHTLRFLNGDGTYLEKSLVIEQ